MKKKDGSLRLCVDFRALNSEGYNQVAVDDKDIHKTAIRVGFG